MCARIFFARTCASRRANWAVGGQGFCVFASITAAQSPRAHSPGLPGTASVRSTTKACLLSFSRGRACTSGFGAVPADTTRFAWAYQLGRQRPFQAKALIAVEPFDGSLCHALNFLMLADLEEHTAASLLGAGLTLVRTVGSGVALLAALWPLRAARPAPRLGESRTGATGFAFHLPTAKRQASAQSGKSPLSD